MARPSRPPTPASDRPDPAEVQAVSDWLVRQGLKTADFAPMFAGFCERLARCGVRLWRGYIGMRTLHPDIEAIGFMWRADTGIERDVFRYVDSDTEAFRASPFNYMLERKRRFLRVRLAGDPGQPDFPIFAEMRAGGATDYYARVVTFDFDDGTGSRAGVITSWTTDRPEGFSDADIATLDRLLPRLGLSLKGTLTYRIARNLLDTYVGPDAGRRILGGRIRRGQAEAIRAVILFADLSGFTAASDTLPREALLPTLDAYFECMVPPVTERGGQVLKFIGDGLLAVFDLSGATRDAICSAALDAAMDARARVAELNAARATGGQPALALHQALHLGEVFYGNVGARDRQDFTVIGPAVNEASRIEELCEALDRELLISGTVAEADPACRARLNPVGFHVLRGVREPLELFAVAEG